MSLYMHPFFNSCTHFFEIFHLKHSKYISKFIFTKTVDIDPLQTQVFHLSNLSTYSLPDQFQVDPFENCPNEISI